jgi:4-amino-4-deoxy-L-arabinose transferase-like glycosyltransferase
MSLREHLARRKSVIFLLALGILNLVVFWQLFGFHANNDTDSYILSIKFFRGESNEVYPNRYLNPFYSVVAATIFRGLSPEHSIIVTNIIFYFGLLLLTYGLLRRVFKSEFIGVISALFISTSYALVRYGLTQVQDIGGYFWFLLTLYCGWRWWEDKKSGWLYIGGVAVSFGMLTKESGAMAALFVGILFLLEKASFKTKIINFLKFSIIPFVVLLINQSRGKEVHYNSGKWFLENWQIFAEANYRFIKWLGVNISTYNFLWLFIFIGAIVLINKRKEISSEIKIYFLAVFLPSMCYFAWPLFISRTVFISAWFFIPLASYGLYHMYNKGKLLRYMAVVAIVFALITPYILQYTLRYAHLFQIMGNCKNDISCTWNYFWDNRDSFSKEL